MKKLAFLVVASVFFMANCDSVSSIASASEEKAATASTTSFKVATDMIMAINSEKQDIIREDNKTTWSNGSSHFFPGNVVAVEGGFDPNNMPFTTRPAFAIHENGSVYKTSIFHGGWEQIWGMANGVDIGSNGDNTYAVNESGQIFKLDGNNFFQWHSSLSAHSIVTKAIRIDVDNNGNPWVVGEDQKVYAYENGAWTLRKEFERQGAIDIGCGNGKVYVAIAGLGYPFGGLFEYDITSDVWLDMGFSAIKVDAEKNGSIYMVDYTGKLTIYNPIHETTVEDIEAGNLIDIGV